MGFINRNTNTVTPKERYTQLFTTARYNILIICALTVVNSILCLTGSETYFLFSAILPYHLVYIGAASANGGLLALAIIFLIASMGAYIACFILGKKHVGWMIAALVMFSIDTVYFIYCFCLLLADDATSAVSSIIDLAFHVYALYYFIAGVVYFFKMKKATETEADAIAAESDAGHSEAFRSDADNAEDMRSGKEIDEITANGEKKVDDK